MSNTLIEQVLRNNWISVFLTLLYTLIEKCVFELSNTILHLIYIKLRLYLIVDKKLFYINKKIHD